MYHTKMCLCQVFVSMLMFWIFQFPIILSGTFFEYLNQYLYFKILFYILNGILKKMFDQLTLEAAAAGLRYR